MLRPAVLEPATPGFETQGRAYSWYSLVRYPIELGGNQAFMTGQRIAWYRLVYSSPLAKVLADLPAEF